MKRKRVSFESDATTSWRRAGSHKHSPSPLFPQDTPTGRSRLKALCGEGKQRPARSRGRHLLQAAVKLYDEPFSPTPMACSIVSPDVRREREARNWLLVAGLEKGERCTNPVTPSPQACTTEGSMPVFTPDTAATQKAQSAPMATPVPTTVAVPNQSPIAPPTLEARAEGLEEAGAMGEVPGSNQEVFADLTLMSDQGHFCEDLSKELLRTRESPRLDLGCMPIHVAGDGMEDESHALLPVEPTESGEQPSSLVEKVGTSSIEEKTIAGKEVEHVALVEAESTGVWGEGHKASMEDIGTVDVAKQPVDVAKQLVNIAKRPRYLSGLDRAGPVLLCGAFVAYLLGWRFGSLFF